MSGKSIRFMLGSIILIGLLVLAVFVALGHVEEKTSYGLTPIMAVLAKVALDFSEWAFRGRMREPKEKPSQPDRQPPIE